MPAGPDIWQPVQSLPDHPMRAVNGAVVGNGVRLSIEIGPKSKVGSDYFRVILDTDSGFTDEAVCSGLINRGPFPGFNWVEVTDFQGRLTLAGEAVQIPEGIDGNIVKTLGRLVPVGGHLMMEYDSPHRAITAKALSQRVPPVATPLGGMMFAANCGTWFTDWYISEGGREGPRKLQGFRAVDTEHAERRGREMLEGLEAFLGRAKDCDWDVQAACIPIAQATVTALRARLAVPDGPMP
jgi:hypothetical protein